MTTMKANGMGSIGLIRRILDWYQKRRDYQRLMALDDYLLKDLGISRSQIAAALSQNSSHVRIRAVKTNGLRHVASSVSETAESLALMTSLTRTPRGKI